MPPRLNIPEPWTAKFPQPPHLGIRSERLEAFVSRLDHPRCGVRIISGDETPNAPELLLNTRIQDKFRHQRGISLSGCATGEKLPPPSHPCRGQGAQYSATTAFPTPQACGALAANGRLDLLLQSPQTSPAHLTRRLIQPALNFFFHKFCQLRRERYVHKFLPGILPPMTKISKSCYSSHFLNPRPLRVTA